MRQARQLVADADTAQQQGEQDRAARMRRRAAERLRGLTTQYPGTWAAGKAKQLLETLAP